MTEGVLDACRGSCGIGVVVAGDSIGALAVMVLVVVLVRVTVIFMVVMAGSGYDRGMYESCGAGRSLVRTYSVVCELKFG